MADIIQRNITAAQIHVGDIFIEIDAIPADPVSDDAYVISLPNTWEDFGTVPINDEIFETDSSVMKNQLAKMQFGMRLIRLPLRIITPKPTNHETAYLKRAEMLHDLQRIMSFLDGYITITVSIRKPRNTNYVIYCHPHGVEAFRVIKQPCCYDVVLTLVADDPLFYAETASEAIKTIVNYGDVADYASITLENPSDLSYIQCQTSSETHVIMFRSAITSDTPLKIIVKYPGQICTVEGTTLSNIQVSDNQPMFLKVPLGSSTWLRNDNGDVKIQTRAPLVGIPP